MSRTAKFIYSGLRMDDMDCMDNMGDYGLNSVMLFLPRVTTVAVALAWKVALTGRVTLTVTPLRPYRPCRHFIAEGDAVARLAF